MSRKHRRPKAEEMRTEYEFDYEQASPNRFASRMHENVVAVILEPDVAKVFDSSESVNRLLRSVIAAVPSNRNHRQPGKRSRKSR